jgi:hypothetical protein
MATVLNAQDKDTIVFALRMDTVVVDPETGEWPDMTWIHVLEDAGYEVIEVYPTSLSTAAAETLDMLNNANLVIIGRSMPTTTLGGNSVDDKIAWNSIAKPILTGNMWAMRSNRLNWFNTTATATVGSDTSLYNATVLEQSDPVFEGIDVSVPVPWLNKAVDVINVEDAGNGLILAAMEGSPAYPLFVRFEPEIDFYPASGDFPVGHRTFFSGGRDASSLPPFNYYPFTEESEKVLLAEVKRLVILGGGSGGGTAVDEQGNAITPSSFVLSQNYPNPFNPSTTIRFSLPSNGFTSLKVYDVLGKEIATIINGTYGAGEHTIQFNASHIPSGIYFYTLRSGSFAETKKMLLLK